MGREGKRVGARDAMLLKPRCVFFFTINVFFFSFFFFPTTNIYLGQIMPMNKDGRSRIDQVPGMFLFIH